jgi:signal transduction histidine kinase
MTVTGAQEARRPDAWSRRRWMWHTIFFATVALATLLTVIDGTLGPGRRMTAVILSAVIACWYWVAGRPCVAYERGTAWTVAYLIGTLALWVGLVFQGGAYYLVLSILYSQVFMLLPLRWGIVGAVVLTAAMAAVNVIMWDITGGALVIFVLSCVFLLALSVAFALWIDGIITQSRERSRLIDELDLTRAELAEAERRAGVLGERQRLASEIHDTLAQGFTSILLLVEAAEAALPPGSEEVAKRLDAVRRTARENLTEARHLVQDLGPAPLESSSLTEALGRTVERLADETGVEAHLEVAGSPRGLPVQAEVTLLRSAQEALSNVRRHARAGSVQVTLTFADAEVTLAVRDDGDGFDTASSNGGFGLGGMRRRVASAGGDVGVTSSPGAGTTVTVRLPVQEDVVLS